MACQCLMMGDTDPMATKKARAKRAPRKRGADRPLLSIEKQLKAAHASYLDFLSKADPDAPELKR